MTKVSIIIPFNNVESYIRECLDSVLAQTLQEIEIICINDASTDSSLDIVKEYMQKDSRIKLLETSKRLGQGYARNRGIEIATGEFIGFVDSDDFIKPEMFEKLYNEAKNNDNDITMCQTVEYNDTTGEYIQSDYYSLNLLKEFENRVFSAEETQKYVLDINVALWNKLYKREFLLEIGEVFPEGFIYEDLPFFFGTYLKAKKIQIVWEEFYFYRINRKNSTMRQFNNKILDRLPMVSLTYEKMKNTPFLHDMKKSIQAWIINDLFHRYTLLKENYQKEFFFLMKKVFENLEIEDINDNYWKRVYHFEGYLLVMNNTFEDFNQKVFNEYLNIHKVEDRIRSQVIEIEEFDSKISGIYSDIGKNYKYTEEIVDKVDKKITDIYSDIEKNYKYTEEIVEKVDKNIIEKVDKKIVYISSLIEQLQEGEKTIKYDIAQIGNMINMIGKDLDKIQSDFGVKVIELENQYKFLLEEQNKKHDEEINQLKQELLQTEQRIYDELTPRWKKFIRKQFLNREK